MQNVKNTMIDRMLAMVAPHLCSGCGKIGTLLCERCKEHIVTRPFTSCIDCRKVTPVGICIKHHKSYQRAWVVGERKTTLQRLIGGFKFQNMKVAAYDLAALLDERLPTLPSNTILIPIPTAPAHKRERGYDHMLLIAQSLSVLRHLPIQQLITRANVATQHHSNREQRIEQSLSAFIVKGSVDPLAHYVVLDDIITTGSTIDQATQLLRNAGAQMISVAALARQPLD